jgi:hypothetical protein
MNTNTKVVGGIEVMISEESEQLIGKRVRQVTGPTAGRSSTVVDALVDEVGTVQVLTADGYWCPAGHLKVLLDMGSVTTEDLIATIAADRDDIVTFHARTEFTRRTRSDWRAYAPANPRWVIGGVMFHSFNDGVHPQG